MKILLLTDTAKSISGWGRYTADLEDALLKEGKEVKIIEGVSPRGYFSNPFFLLHLLLDIPRIRRIYRAYDPDVLHITAEPYLLLLPFLSLQGKKVVLTVHGSYAYLPVLVSYFLHPLYRFLYVQALSRVDHIIAVSDYTKQYLLHQTKKDGVLLSPEQIQVIHNGIRVSEYPLIRASQPHTHKTVLTVGAVKSRKGIVEAIRALGAYSDISETSFSYRVVGTNEPEASYARLLQDEIKKQQLEGCVTFVGRVTQEQLQQEYERADLFLLLSRIQRGNRFEGFGLVCLEANAYGVPVIASNEGGIVEAVSEGVSGFIVDPEDPQEVARRIEQVLDGHKINRNAARTWAEEHNISKIIKRILVLYGLL